MQASRFMFDLFSDFADVHNVEAFIYFTLNESSTHCMIKLLCLQDVL